MPVDDNESQHKSSSSDDEGTPKVEGLKLGLLKNIIKSRSGSLNKSAGDI
jgi:hypothetical protein